MNIIANSNAMPGGTGSYFSGLRVATMPMITSGMGPGDFDLVVKLLHRGLDLARDLSAERGRRHREHGECRTPQGGIIQVPGEQGE